MSSVACRPDTIVRLSVGVGCTPSTPKEVDHARKRGVFVAAHDVLDVTKSRAWCLGFSRGRPAPASDDLSSFELLTSVPHAA